MIVYVPFQDNTQDMPNSLYHYPIVVHSVLEILICFGVSAFLIDLIQIWWDEVALLGVLCFVSMDKYVCCAWYIRVYFFIMHFWFYRHIFFCAITLSCTVLPVGTTSGSLLQPVLKESPLVMVPII